LAVDGTLWVVSTLPPRLGSPVISGTSLTLSAAGGTPGWPCYVLAATNVASPIVEWTGVATNQFDTSGSLSLTLPLNPAVPERYYRVQVP
ncbi:MAG TPA: hypothetical protein VNZ22_10575, partial [Bacillota bacterium]|nr:hypothetical protein [Bacillota bacterium]